MKSQPTRSHCAQITEPTASRIFFIMKPPPNTSSIIINNHKYHYLNTTQYRTTMRRMMKKHTRKVQKKKKKTVKITSVTQSHTPMYQSKQNNPGQNHPSTACIPNKSSPAPPVHLRPPPSCFSMHCTGPHMAAPSAIKAHGISTGSAIHSHWQADRQSNLRLNT